MIESRLQPHFSYRDLVRAYVGDDATDPECDYAWWHIARYPASLDICEGRLLFFASCNRPCPLAAIQRARAKADAASDRADKMSARRIAELREIVGLTNGDRT